MKRLVYLFKYCKLLLDIKIYGSRYDGIYVYECPKCVRRIYTVYGDKGITPFAISCSKCNNMMAHSKTIEGKPWIRPTPWVRPTFRQMLKLSPEMIEYVLGGGLILKTHLK